MPKVLIAIPPAMLAVIDQIAVSEHRNRSDLVREALRQYCERYHLKRVQYGRSAPPVTDIAIPETP